MNSGKTLFAQIMEFIPWPSFARIVQRHRGNAGVRTLSCAEQFRAMAFAQLTWRESLRDIEASLLANAPKLYAMGFRSAVKRSTLADANELRDWRIWADLAALLIRRARKLYASESLAVELDNTVYALDSTTIVKPRRQPDAGRSSAVRGLRGISPAAKGVLRQESVVVPARARSVNESARRPFLSDAARVAWRAGRQTGRGRATKRG